MNVILVSVLLMGGLGVVFGTILSVAGKKLAVVVDPILVAIREALPGANCGACGFPGCDGFADAVFKGNASTGGCPVGRKANLKEKLDGILAASHQQGDGKVDG